MSPPAFSASQPLYSVEQVAERLGLHVRTVRAYVREGRLKATRIGKQYRIAHADLEALTGAPVAPQSPGRTRHVDVTAVVDIDVIAPEAAMRVSNGLVAAANMHARTGQGRLRVDTSYDEVRARLKIVLTGDHGPVSAMLGFIGNYLDQQDQQP
ncbi:MAG: helix-turn-helix domain-containing protein [Alphaproteobacteria bacterium]|nr:helix-turn-helix domain-containing protein [Alphaproteobacteria bacterium]